MLQGNRKELRGFCVWKEACPGRGDSLSKDQGSRKFSKEQGAGVTGPLGSKRLESMSGLEQQQELAEPEGRGDVRDLGLIGDSTRGRERGPRGQEAAAGPARLRVVGWP